MPGQSRSSGDSILAASLSNERPQIVSRPVLHAAGRIRTIAIDACPIDSPSADHAREARKLDRESACIFRTHFLRTHAAGVISIDLDDLKLTNDTEGHCRGDRLLMDCAHTKKQTIRQNDLAARVVGDEFAVLATETNEAGLELLQFRIQATLRLAGISASLGRASRHPRGKHSRRMGGCRSIDVRMQTRSQTPPPTPSPRGRNPNPANPILWAPETNRKGAQRRRSTLLLEKIGGNTELIGTFIFNRRFCCPDDLGNISCPPAWRLRKIKGVVPCQ